MKNRPLDPPITFDARTFGRSGKGSFQAAWDDVRRITGYKIDLFTWDEIRMDFDLVGGATIVLTEDSPGFAEFMNEVERRFSSVSGWHGKIAQPTFSANKTVLHESAL